MTQLDDRDTQPISMPELLSTTATIAMPRRVPVLRDRRVQVVAFVGVAAVVAAFVCLKPFSPTASGTPVVSRPARSAAATVSQGPAALSFPTDGATLPAVPSHAVSAPAVALSRPQPSVSRPVAVVAPPSPSPSPSGSASSSPFASASASSSASNSSSVGVSASTSESESP